MNHAQRTVRLPKSRVGLVLFVIAISFLMTGNMSTVSADSPDEETSTPVKKSTKRSRSKSRLIIPPPLEDLGRDYKDTSCLFRSNG